ncbi:DNA topoisomerase 1 [Neopestalotiopsis sp. 37M]|nr:DNA topoisomerase 1 [Neopestalotiopsis sp. 37M]
MASDFSDDDMPLSRPNGRLSAATVSKQDQAMDASSKGGLPAPVSIRNGPVNPDDSMDVDGQHLNGLAKRKSRTSAVSYKDESDSDDAPIAKRQRKSTGNVEGASLPPKPTKADFIDSDSDDDKPLTAKLAQKKKDIEVAAAREARNKRKSIKDESDSDAPLAAPKKRQSNGVAKSNGVKRDPDSDSDAPLKKAPAKKVASRPAPATKGKATATPAKKTPAKKVAQKAASSKAASEDVEDDDEAERWWDKPMIEDDGIKWQTLEHNGVMFPPDYEPLPKNVKLIYDGTPVVLQPEAEEVAGFYGAMIDSQHASNPVFQKNFFEDFRGVLAEHGGAKDKQGNKVNIKEFEKCDFKPIFDYYKAKSEAKKQRTKEEKKAEKEKKDKEEEPFKFCVWNGRKEKVGNFRIEPPSLFRGRGEHPKTGRLKLRVEPEQVTINIGKGAKVPEPPAGHKWKAVKHDQNASWLAMWQENINGNYKYVMTGADSSTKGQSDFKKFEKARSLKKYIDRIRRDYNKDLKSSVMGDRQRATAIYLIDKLALRAGNEKDTENEAETVGCCSLKYQHITLREPQTVIFDFLGKDSIRYYDEVQVEKQVFKNIRLFKKPPKGEGDDIFDRLTTSSLNKYLTGYMPGLTAKVFRTYNASWTMSRLLKELKFPPGATIADKMVEYTKANREVAILCNHKRTVGANHAQAMEKMGDRIKGIKFQIWRHKLMLLNLDPKLKKKKGADYFALEEELNNDEWVQAHITFLVEEQRTKITKKFETDNKKRVENKEKPFPEKELKERLKAADDLGKERRKEWKSKKVEAEGKGPTVQKIEAKIEKLEASLNQAERKMETQEDNKEVALGTSKINYIDPRLSVVFCKKFDVPINKVFSKTLEAKFEWAIKSVDENWEF